MPIPSGLKAKIDGRVSLMLTHLEARQEAYIAAHGRYFQGIRTHAVLPKGEIDEETPPNSRVKPTDQAEDWDDVGIVLPANMPMALAIDVYESSDRIPDETQPRGFRLEPYHGWSIRVEIEHLGRAFARQIGFGPDAAGYTYSWQDMTDD